VTVCDGGGTCLPATTFAWQNAGQPFTNPALWIASYGNVAATGGFDEQSNYPRYLADVNGDGLPDVVGIAGANVYVSLNVGSGFADPQLWLSCSFTTVCGGWPTQSVTTVPASCNGVSCVGAMSGSYPRLVMDMNGDGRADILGIGATAIYVSLGTGSGFTGPQTWLNCSFTANCAGSGFNDDNVYPRYVVDVNGDGLPDIVGFGGSDVYVSLNTGTGFSGPQAWLHCSFTVTCGGWTDNTNYPRFLMDVNGDGLADIVGFSGDHVYVSLNTGSGFAGPQAWLYCSFTLTCGGWPNDAAVYPRWLIDVNGDHLPDIVGISGNDVLVSLNTGTGFATPQTWLHCSFTPTCGGWPSDTGYPRYLIDVNGDGLPDLVGFSGANVYVSLNTGSGFGGPQVALSCSFTISCAGWTDNNVFPRIMTDLNGDGLADIAGFGANGVNVSLVSGPGKPDLLTSVTTGMGIVTTVTYKTLIGGTTYSPDSGSKLPTIDVMGATNVVSRVDTSNGVGGAYGSTYSYVGAKADLAGRGFLGFRQMAVKDLQTNIADTTTYRQDFPYLGLVASTTRSFGTQTLGQSTNTYQFSNASGTTAISPASAPYRVSLSQNVSSGNDLDGSALPTVTTSNQYDAFGNATQVVVSTPDGFSKTTTNTFTNDATNWYLGRLVGASVTSVAP
jgi:Insecticide toxin TcdB middle/N-terminal region